MVVEVFELDPFLDYIDDILAGAVQFKHHL